MRQCTAPRRTIRLKSQTIIGRRGRTGIQWQGSRKVHQVVGREYYPCERSERATNRASGHEQYVIFMSPLLGSVYAHDHWHDLWLFLTFRMDNTLSQQLNGPFWTLAIEFQFYLLLRIIVWLFSLIVRRGAVHWRILKLTLCLLAMTAWGLLTRYWGLLLPILQTGLLDPSFCLYCT